LGYPILIFAIARYNSVMDEQRNQDEQDGAGLRTVSAEAISFLDEEKVEEMHEFFLFELDGELYAVPVLDVDQVMRVPPVTMVPSAPDSVLGVFHLRGRVIVALDLMKRMHLTRTKAFVSNFLFIAHRVKNYYAILIDRTREVVHVSRKEVTPLDPVIASHIPPKYSKGMFLYRDMSLARDMSIPGKKEEKSEEEGILRPVIVLNTEELLSQSDLLLVAMTAQKASEGLQSNIPTSQG